jgi:chromate transporter
MTAHDEALKALVVVLVPLSLVSFGGGPAALAELQQQAVVIHGWTSHREFADLFALSRAAPGPGALLATLIGWKAAGWLGALVASLAFFLPSSLLIYAAVHLSRRGRASPWGRAAEAGLAPIGVGLMLAGAYAVLQPETTAGATWALALTVAAARIWRPNLHPIVLVGIGAGVFVFAAQAGFPVRGEPTSTSTGTPNLVSTAK